MYFFYLAKYKIFQRNEYKQESCDEYNNRYQYKITCVIASNVKKSRGKKGNYESEKKAYYFRIKEHC